MKKKHCAVLKASSSCRAPTQAFFTLNLALQTFNSAPEAPNPILEPETAFPTFGEGAAGCQLRARLPGTWVDFEFIGI